MSGTLQTTNDMQTKFDNCIVWTGHWETTCTVHVYKLLNFCKTTDKTTRESTCEESSQYV